MKKINALYLAAVLGVLALAATAIANVTTLTTPGNSGRPMADSKTNARTDSLIMNREVMDTSPFYTASPTSATTQPVNITSTAGLCWCSGASTTGSSYPGPYVLNVDNVGASSVVVFVDTTPTAINSTITAGTVIAAGAGAQIQIGNYDGITAHLIGLTATTTVRYSVSTK